MILDRLHQSSQAKRLRALYEKYERFLIPTFLAAGFLGHFFTFRVLEVNITLIGLGVYATVAAASILYAAIYDARGGISSRPWLQRLRLLSPLLVQLAFGSLLSMAMLFYWFSGALSATWPILAVIAGVVVSNETFRHWYVRPSVQVPVFAFALFSYFSLLFPFVYNSLDAGTFVAGGLASLAICLVMVAALMRFAPALRPRWKRYTLSVVAVFAVMNGLYFLNVIPPIPLSLREAGVYYNVQRLNGGVYRLTGEPETWWQSLLPGQTLHADGDKRLYAYTAIYAPADLNTTIYDRWEHQDPASGKWTTMARISFTITGGRSAGYRGYTFITRPLFGNWQVSVETERGQVLGRIPFTYVP